MTTKPILALIGFAGDGLDTMCGIEYAEAGDQDSQTGERFVWADAVGDWKVVDPTHPDYNLATAVKWGPSIGPSQTRALKFPHVWGPEDHVREVYALLNPYYNAYAAFIISKKGTDFAKWSTFRNGTYVEWVGQSFPLRTGHPYRDKWKLGYPTPPA